MADRIRLEGFGLCVDVFIFPKRKARVKILYKIGSRVPCRRRLMPNEESSFVQQAQAVLEARRARHRERLETERVMRNFPSPNSCPNCGYPDPAEPSPDRCPCGNSRSSKR
jgi:rubrerythrin